MFSWGQLATALLVPLLPVPRERPCHVDSGLWQITSGVVGLAGTGTVTAPAALPGVPEAFRSRSHGTPLAGLWPAAGVCL